jgi:hypothetical protein
VQLIFFWNGLAQNSVELIPDGLAVSRRRTRPASVNIGRSVGLRKTIVALGRGGSDDCAKHFEIHHNGHNFAAAARFHQLLINWLIAPTFLKRIIVIA